MKRFLFVLIAVFMLDVAFVPRWVHAACSLNDPDDGCPCGQENTNNPGEPTWCTDCGAYADCDPEPEIPWCELGEYLKWNGSRWVCDRCPDKYPNSPQHQAHLVSCYIENTTVCGDYCMLYADGHTQCNGSAVGKHLEYDENDNLVCYNDNLPCSDFATNGCTQSSQSGAAHWKQIMNSDNVIHNPWEYAIQFYYAWDVNECKCEQSVNLSNYNCTGKRSALLNNNVVTDMLGRGSYEQAVYSRRDTIKYRPGTNYYCTHCDAGKYPRIFDKTNVPRPYSACSKNDDGVYIACACSDVEVGFYSDGCNIEYPLNSEIVPNACHIQCPDDMTTLNPGASSQNECVPDGEQIYCDETGCFHLGQNACS